MQLTRRRRRIGGRRGTLAAAATPAAASGRGHSTTVSLHDTRPDHTSPNAHDDEKNHQRGRLRRRRVLARSQNPSPRSLCDEPRACGGLVSSSAQTRSRRRPSSKQVGRVVERANKIRGKQAITTKKHKTQLRSLSPHHQAFVSLALSSSRRFRRCVSTQRLSDRRAPKSQALFMAREALQRRSLRRAWEGAR